MKERNYSLDFLKVLLTVGMIIAHSVQFLGRPSKVSFLFSEFINLITFSGFMFCFGYAVSISYLKKEKKQISRNLTKNFLKILMVFYVSGISYEIFVSKNISIVELFKILFLFRIPGYSEFLAAFSVLNIITLIFFNQFKKILKINKYFIVVLSVSLLSTFIPYKFIKLNQIGLIIGDTKFACFPILQYLSYYILGMYFQENKIKFNLKYFIISTISSFMFISYAVLYKKLPSRFPPSILWILGAAMFLYIYYIFSIYIVSKIKVHTKIYFIGENTLSFLLISNLILFMLKYLNPDKKLGFILCILVGGIIVILIYIMIYLCKNMFGSNEKITIKESV